MTDRLLPSEKPRIEERRLDRTMKVTMGLIYEAMGNGANRRQIVALIEQGFEEREDEIVLLQTLSQSFLAMEHVKRLPKIRTILVDGKPFIVEAEQTCAMIKALVQKDLQYQLFLENATQKQQDRFIHPSDILTIVDGMKFYTVPPAAFGYYPICMGA